MNDTSEIIKMTVYNGLRSKAIIGVVIIIIILAIIARATKLKEKCETSVNIAEQKSQE